MADPVLENQLEDEQEQLVDTSNPQEVNKARKKYARKRADRLKFINAAMQHEEGRAWYYDILVFCKVFENPYDPDPYRTAFVCGERNVGLRILDDIQTAAPQEYLKMVNENKRNRE